MSNRRLSFLTRVFCSFVFSITWSSSYSVAQVPVADTTVAAVDIVHPPAEFSQLESFLLSLHNGLIRNGMLSWRMLRTPQELWWNSDFVRFQAALEAYIGSSGAVVTPSILYPPKTVASVRMNDAGILRFRMPSTGMQYFLGKRKGLHSCTLLEVRSDDEDRVGKILTNIRCVAAQYLRQRFLQSEEDFFGDVFIQSSGVDSALNSYLATLVGEQLISSYSVDLPAQRVYVWTAPDPDPVLLLLSPSDVNVSKDSANEIEQAQGMLNEGWLAEEFVFASVDREPFRVRNETLHNAMLQLIELEEAGASPEERRDAFFAAFGLQPPQAARAPGCPAVPEVSYPSGTVTPSNKDVIDFKGPGADFADNLPIKQALVDVGYARNQIDGGSIRMNTINRLCPMRSAQTIFFNAHGGSTDLQLICDPDIQYGTKECCEFMKAAAVELGLNNATSIDCDGHPRAPDPTFTLSTTGSKPQCYIEDNSDVGDRCLVLFNIPNAWKTPSGLNRKAAVFTSQCDGGQCTGRAYNPTRIMDLYTGANVTNYTNIIKCDAEIYAKDLKHRAQYCRDPNNTTATEPFAESRCEEDYGLSPSDPFRLKSVQGSIGYRTTAGVAQSRWRCPDPGHNTSGFKRYHISQAGGHADTSVEFYPTVADVDYDGFGGSFSLQLSSRLNATIQVDPIQPNFPQRIRARSNFDEPLAVTDHSIEFNLNDNLNMAPEGLFALPKEDLTRIYGRNQDDWPWYLTVKIPSGVAPNNVNFVGNQEAQKKWVYPDTNNGHVPAWKKFNGRIPEGRRQFEVRLPGLPLSACCKPNLERDSNGRFVQNGCTCRSNLFLDRCSTSVCCIGQNCSVDTHTEQSCRDAGGTYTNHAGQLHMWAQCCGASGTDCDATRVERVIEEPQCPRDNNAVYERLFDQYRRMPFDDNQPGSCQGIERRWECGSSSSSDSSDDGGDPGSSDDSSSSCQPRSRSSDSSDSDSSASDGQSSSSSTSEEEDDPCDDGSSSSSSDSSDDSSDSSDSSSSSSSTSSSSSGGGSGSGSGSGSGGMGCRTGQACNFAKW